MSSFNKGPIFWGAAGVLLCAAVAASAYYLIVGPSTPTDPPPDPPVPPGKIVSTDPLFEDVTKKCGIVMTARNGDPPGLPDGSAKALCHYAILDSLGIGIGFIDLDGDGKLYIFIPGGGYYEKNAKELAHLPEGQRVCKILGHPGKLYKNLGNWRFEDVTDKVMPDQAVFYSHGCAVVDYDRDGWADLLVTGWGRVALYHNEPMDPTDPSKGRKLVDVTEKSGLTGITWATSAAWADLDGDGWPDLYLCQYVDWSFAKNPVCGGYSGGIPRDVCPPKKFNGLPHLLFRNNGNGTFTEVGARSGLTLPGMKDAKGNELDPGKGLGVVIADFNGDGAPDIYVANDTVYNFLYVNRNSRRRGATVPALLSLPRPGLAGNLGLADVLRWRTLAFEEVAQTTSTAGDDRGSAQGSMGLGVGDPYGFGLPSIFVTNYEGELHALYRNRSQDGHLDFSFDTLPSGIAALGQRFVGFGTAFVDVDNDGWEDIVIANGHVIKFPTQSSLLQKPVLMHNQGGKQGGKFKAITERGGSYFTTPHLGRGLAVGDLDNDGRADLAFCNVNEPVAVLRNISHEGETRPHWIGLDLAGRDHRCVVGARVTVETEGRKLYRFLASGVSYLSACDQRILVGLGQAKTIQRISVDWPWGETQHWQGDAFSLDAYWRLTEDDATPKKLYTK